MAAPVCRRLLALGLWLSLGVLAQKHGPQPKQDARFSGPHDSNHAILFTSNSTPRPWIRGMALQSGQRLHPVPASEKERIHLTKQVPHYQKNAPKSVSETRKYNGAENLSLTEEDSREYFHERDAIYPDDCQPACFHPGMYPWTKIPSNTEVNRNYITRGRNAVKTWSTPTREALRPTLKRIKVGRSAATLQRDKPYYSSLMGQVNSEEYISGIQRRQNEEYFTRVPRHESRVKDSIHELPFKREGSKSERELAWRKGSNSRSISALGEVERLEIKLLASTAILNNFLRVLGYQLHEPEAQTSREENFIISALSDSIRSGEINTFDLHRLVKKLSTESLQMQYVTVMKEMMRLAPTYLKSSIQHLIRLSENKTEIASFAKSHKLDVANLLVNIDEAHLGFLSKQDVRKQDKGAEANMNTGEIFSQILSSLSEERIPLTPVLFSQILLHLPLEPIGVVGTEMINSLAEILSNDFSKQEWNRLVNQLKVTDKTDVYSLVRTLLLHMSNGSKTLVRDLSEFILPHIAKPAKLYQISKLKSLTPVRNKNDIIDLLKIITQLGFTDDVISLKDLVVEFLHRQSIDVEGITKGFSQYYFGSQLDYITALLIRMANKIPDMPQDVRWALRSLTSHLAFKKNAQDVGSNDRVGAADVQLMSYAFVNSEYPLLVRQAVNDIIAPELARDPDVLAAAVKETPVSECWSPTKCLISLIRTALKQNAFESEALKGAAEQLLALTNDHGVALPEPGTNGGNGQKYTNMVNYVNEGVNTNTLFLPTTSSLGEVYANGQRIWNNHGVGSTYPSGGITNLPRKQKQLISTINPLEQMGGVYIYQDPTGYQSYQTQPVQQDLGDHDQVFPVGNTGMHGNSQQYPPLASTQYQGRQFTNIPFFPENTVISNPQYGQTLEEQHIGYHFPQQEARIPGQVIFQQDGNILKQNHSPASVPYQVTSVEQSSPENQAYFQSAGGNQPVLSGTNQIQKYSQTLIPNQMHNQLKISKNKQQFSPSGGETIDTHTQTFLESQIRKAVDQMPQEIKILPIPLPNGMDEKLPVVNDVPLDYLLPETTPGTRDHLRIAPLRAFFSTPNLTGYFPEDFKSESYPFRGMFLRKILKQALDQKLVDIPFFEKDLQTYLVALENLTNKPNIEVNWESLLSCISNPMSDSEANTYYEISQFLKPTLSDLLGPNFSSDVHSNKGQLLSGVIRHSLTLKSVQEDDVLSDALRYYKDRILLEKCKSQPIEYVMVQHKLISKTIDLNALFRALDSDNFDKAAKTSFRNIFKFFSEEFKPNIHLNRFDFTKFNTKGEWLQAFFNILLQRNLVSSKYRHDFEVLLPYIRLVGPGAEAVDYIE